MLCFHTSDMHYSVYRTHREQMFSKCLCSKSALINTVKLAWWEWTPMNLTQSHPSRKPIGCIFVMFGPWRLSYNHGWPITAYMNTHFHPGCPAAANWVPTCKEHQMLQITFQGQIIAAVIINRPIWLKPMTELNKAHCGLIQWSDQCAISTRNLIAVKSSTACCANSLHLVTESVYLHLQPIHWRDREIYTGE